MTTTTTEYTQKQWSKLCRDVKGLVPEELGLKAWYLIIVSKFCWRLLYRI